MSSVVRRFVFPALFFTAVALQAGAQQAATPAPAPPPLQHIDLPTKTLQEAIMMKRDVAPGGTTGPHTHPGVEVSYVIAGEMELHIAGQPTRVLHAGDSSAIPRDTVHEGINIGKTTLTLLVTYIVDKGAPVRMDAAPLSK
jgi:quercetin dioxygenase-like cupin family protein